MRLDASITPLSGTLLHTTPLVPDTPVHALLQSLYLCNERFVIPWRHPRLKLAAT